MAAHAAESSTVQMDGHVIELTRLDKELFPSAHLTKGDLVRHYRRLADVMLPHLRDRPLSLQRFPDGLAGSGFYQKEVPAHFPDWIERVELVVKEDGRRQEQVMAQKRATLVYLGQQACVTPHPWLSRADQPERPDRLLFDLDPPETGDAGERVLWGMLREAAEDLRRSLESHGLTPFVMTTGSTGLHVVAPLKRGPGFDEVRGFARDVADELVARAPDRYTTAPRKADRAGRLYLDTQRNAYGQTGAAPYAVRARRGAPVATPLHWPELRQSRMHPRRYGMTNILRRLGQKADPWAEINASAATLPG